MDGVYFYTYWCINTEGVKTSFTSEALLDVGLRITDEYGLPATIVDMDAFNTGFFSPQELKDDYEMSSFMF